MSASPNDPRFVHQLPEHDPDSGVVGTLQSLIVAFVLAMTFRGFVAEGFVIPTGSMAPTLLGQHYLVHSQLTGATYAVGLGEQRTFVDPMLGPGYGIERGLRFEVPPPRTRSGDRILVLKGLYSFSEPQRWDVIVFKNPTDPKGEAGNYIKRLVGLPNETVWIADGDVFVKRPGDENFVIQRKPEHVQRALWQPIHHSDYTLVRPELVVRSYEGPPWEGEEWDTSGRAYRTDTPDPTALAWHSIERALDDWTTYNMLLSRIGYPVPVSDIRIAAGIVADQTGLTTTLELEARGHVFEFSLGDGEARVRYGAADTLAWIAEQTAEISAFRPGRVSNVEFWHVDQSMSIYLDGRRVAHLDYHWSPLERLEHATNVSGRQAVGQAERGALHRSNVTWFFEGSPVTLHHVRVDRDLYYRAASLDPRQQQNPPGLTGPGFGTHPDNLAVLGPDDFYMLGDNSQASLDSRVWGMPHPLVIAQFEDEAKPFVVHRKLLLGKAWVVYFPAPYATTEGGIAFIPDFGRLRYIR